MKRIALAVCLFALALPAVGNTLFLDVDGHKVAIETKAAPVNAVLEDGSKVATWEPRDAAAIAQALAAQDLAWAIPGTLGGLKVTDRAPSCLTLTLDDYGAVSVTLPGKIAKAANGRVVWTPDQIEAIQTRLHSIGREDALPLVFGLTLHTPTTDELAAVSPQGDTVLTPACGQCLSGKVCTVNGQTNCCSGTGACTACKTCAPKRGGGQIEPEL